MVFDWVDLSRTQFLRADLPKAKFFEFYGKPSLLIARHLHLAESVLIPVQLGFFLFALRNRFRR